MGVILKNSNRNENIDNRSLELRKWLRQNADNINVEVMNFTVGDVVYTNLKTGEAYTWSGGGDTRILPLSVIVSMMSNGKTLLTSLVLGITEHYYTGMDVDLTIEDIVRGFDLSEIYSPFGYDLTSIDSLIIESSVDDFRDLCVKCTVGVVERITERYKYLRREGHVNDRGKEAILGEIINRSYIFGLE